MPEISTVQLGIIVSMISLVFVTGLLWCFCCGTCVGRSLLRHTPLHAYTRDASSRPQGPMDMDEEHADDQHWLLMSWSELDDLTEEHP
ncbi:hypothetical protein BC940DRAFT_332765 [Gongronella butleri]|nr:hypothetical protein BC940DRAFT_332765 [Gongronella butleri]